MKNLVLGLVASTALFVGSSLAAEPQGKAETTVKTGPDGSYEGKSQYENTDVSGTTVKSVVHESEGKTWLGKDKAETKAIASTDPKGLGNKTWTQTESSAISDKKGNIEKTYDRRSVDTSGTEHATTEKVKTRVNSDGSTETSVAREVAHDPKGLMNKKVEKTEETIKREADGTVSKSVESKVNQ